MKKLVTKNGRLANILYILAELSNGMTQKSYTLILKDFETGKKFWFDITENQARRLNFKEKIWVCEYYHKLDGELIIEWHKERYFRFI